MNSLHTALQTLSTGQAGIHHSYMTLKIMLCHTGCCSVQFGLVVTALIASTKFPIYKQSLLSINRDDQKSVPVKQQCSAVCKITVSMDSGIFKIL